MEEVDRDIVIVGAGISGLTTSLALHRYTYAKQPKPADIERSLCLSCKVLKF